MYQQELNLFLQEQLVGLELVLLLLMMMVQEQGKAELQLMDRLVQQVHLHLLPPKQDHLE